MQIRKEDVDCRHCGYTNRVILNYDGRTIYRCNKCGMLNSLSARVNLMPEIDEKEE